MRGVGIVRATLGDLLSGVGDRVGGEPAPRPRLTRRGWALAGVIAVLLALGWSSGARQINAVVAPALVALLVGFVSVRRSKHETVELGSPPPGVPSEERTFAVELEGTGLATVSLDLPESTPLTGDGGTDAGATVTLPETVEWTVSPAERGVYEVGPLEMRIHGPLGLVERPVRETASTELVVYPRRYDLTEPAAASGELHTRQETVTQEFDRVREYNPGDPLRKIDWKSSAKHSDLHVVEFSEHAGQEAVVVAGVAARTAVDEMARTVATLVEAALDAGLDVGLTVPAGDCEPDSGPAHRERLLRLLARTGPSTRASDYAAAATSVSEGVDIVVDAGDAPLKDDSWEPTVRTAYDSYSLGELRAGETEVAE